MKFSKGQLLSKCGRNNISPIKGGFAEQSDASIISIYQKEVPRLRGRKMMSENRPFSDLMTATM
jgi:hypothetical protein